MENHKEWHLLSAYLDDELDKPARSMLDIHLVDCEECGRTLNRLRQMKVSLARAEKRPLPADLFASLERQLTPAPFWRAALGWLQLPRIWIPAGAVAATMLSIGVWKWNAEPEPLPMDALLAAHSRYQEETLLPGGDLANSNFSAQLANYQYQSE